jgi:hypothetical protein
MISTHTITMPDMISGMKRKTGGRSSDLTRKSLNITQMMTAMVRLCI